MTLLEKLKLAVQILEGGLEWEYDSPHGWITGRDLEMDIGCSIRIKEYRIAPKEEWIPLEACDMPPGSVARQSLDMEGEWSAIVDVAGSGVTIMLQLEEKFVEWDDLLNDEWEIRYPGSTEWVPCRKLKNSPAPEASREA